MAKPRRFPVIIEFYTTEEHGAAFDALAANGLLTKSDLYRLSFDTFLRQQGMLPSRMKTPERDRANAA
ncbi:hypothetical protein [Bradyrhizobium genosp. A]|uniref:hypothetical protein n=1 Tax=Bradyrhizobium genosp. A TaxID=83626 RepID=UPI003CEDB4B7